VAKRFDDYAENIKKALADGKAAENKFNGEVAKRNYLMAGSYLEKAFYSIDRKDGLSKSQVLQLRNLFDGASPEATMSIFGKLTRIDVELK
jgi:hypothetical protein